VLPADVCKTPTKVFIEAQNIEANNNEASRRFEKAYEHLLPCEADLDQSQQQHLANLRALVMTARAKASDHIQFAAERTTSLRQVIAKLDPVRDSSLMSFADELLDDFDTIAKGFPATTFAQVLVRAWDSRLPR
jgi:hypothetical protein